MKHSKDMDKKNRATAIPEDLNIMKVF